MDPQDLFPDKTLEQALVKHRERFPEGGLEPIPGIGRCFISLPLKDGGTHLVDLTWQQAKYLAYTDLTGDEVKEGRYPPDWPHEVGSRD